jgi:DNA replication protein DnaD
MKDITVLLYWTNMREITSYGVKPLIHQSELRTYTKVVKITLSQFNNYGYYKIIYKELKLQIIYKELKLQNNWQRIEITNNLQIEITK